jgi:predicted dienelactone hydrolase
MRTLEILTAILLFITWGGFMAPPDKRPRPLDFLPFITVIMALVQIIVEEYRWQMAPIYILAGVLFLISLPRLVGPRKKTISMQPIRRRGLLILILKVTGILLGEVFLLVVIALPALIPVPKLPKPTGPYTVGTIGYEWVDESRLETSTTAPNDHRDLLVRVWYPSAYNPAEFTPADYIPGGDNSEETAPADKITPGEEKSLQLKPALFWPEAKIASPLLAKTMGMPSFMFSYLRLVRSHSYQKVPLSPAQKIYPVLLFSHGYGGTVNQNTTQMEELASHGYIIFSIAHPYDALEVFYPSGRMVPARTSIIVKKMASPKLQSIWRRYLSARDPEVQANYYLQYVAQLGELQTSLNTWTEDTIFVLNELERITQSQSGDPLAGRLNLERVGVFGHSFGGAIAAQACQRDSRFKAGVNLDGFQLGDLLDHPIQQPLMMMYSQTNTNCNDLIYKRGNNIFYRLSIKTATHMNYTDFSLFSPLFKYTGILGPIDGTRMEVIVNHYLLAFFDKYLKGIDTHLLDGPDPGYPEVNFQVRNLKQ